MRVRVGGVRVRVGVRVRDRGRVRVRVRVRGSADSTAWNAGAPLSRAAQGLRPLPTRAGSSSYAKFDRCHSDVACVRGIHQGPSW